MVLSVTLSFIQSAIIGKSEGLKKNDTKDSKNGT